MTTTSTRPVAFDLFAGAGGLSLGLEQAGFDVKAALEIDPIHAAIHEANFPHTAVLCRDIAQVSGAELRRAAGIGRKAVDLVAGGPPCQGFSLMGKRVLEDPRNSLVQHFLRIVDEVRPRVFVMENVPGMVSGKHTQLLDELIESFDDIGYRVRMPYQLLNAAHYGVPQNRKRLFLYGARRGVQLPDYPVPFTATPAEVQANKHDGRPLCPTSRDALGDLPDIAARAADQGDVRTWTLNGGSDYAKRMRGDVRDPGNYAHPRTRTHVGMTGCRAANHTERSRTRFRATTPGTTEPISRFYRLAPDGISNTLRAGTATDRGAYTAPRPIHYKHARCISVREAARLHSYPDWFRFHHTIWHGFREIGNSVPPLLARAVGESVRAALNVKPERPKGRIKLGNDALTHITMKAAAAHFDVDHHVIAPRTRTASK